MLIGALAVHCRSGEQPPVWRSCDAERSRACRDERCPWVEQRFRPVRRAVSARQCHDRGTSPV